MFTSPPCWVISTLSSANRPSIEQLVFSAEYSILDSCFGESWAKKKEEGKKTSLFFSCSLPEFALHIVQRRLESSQKSQAPSFKRTGLLSQYFLKQGKTVWKGLNSYKVYKSVSLGSSRLSKVFLSTIFTL